MPRIPFTLVMEIHENGISEISVEANS